MTYLVTNAGDDGVSISTPAVESPAEDPAAPATPGEATPGEETTPPADAPPAEPKEPALEAGPGLPGEVARALNGNDVVVLFFYEPSGSDDQATRAAVRAVRAAGGGGVSLFQDTVARISDYRRLVSSLAISQSPAMVVIDRDRKARLLEGYHDAGTIRQTIRDAL